MRERMRLAQDEARRSPLNQLLIQIGVHPRQADAPEEGMPATRGTKRHPSAITPNGDDMAGQTRRTGLPLDLPNDLVLFRLKFPSKRRVQGDNDHIDPLFSKVCDFKSQGGDSREGGSHEKSLTGVNVSSKTRRTCYRSARGSQKAHGCLRRGALAGSLFCSSQRITHI